MARKPPNNEVVGVRRYWVPAVCARYTTTLFLLVLLGAGTTLGQNKAPDLTQVSLEDLMEIEIYSASRESEKVAQAPSSVSVITGDEIRKYGYRTLADILRSIRGFYVTYDRNYSYVGIRGFARHGDYNTRILLLVDGHRLNDNIYDEALLGSEFPIDLDLIERIEIVRGPSSSLYGTSAFFGVINVITRKRASLSNGEISGEAGSFGSYKGRATLGRSFGNGLDMLLSGSFYDSRGQERLFFNEYNAPDTNRGYALNADGDQSRDFLANISLNNFKLQGVYGIRQKHIPTGAYDTAFNDGGTRTIDTQGYIDLGYERSFGKDWGVLGHVSYNRYVYDGYYIYADPTGGTITNRDYGFGEWWGWEAQIRRRIGQRHRLTFGAEYRDNMRQEQRNYDILPFALYLNDAHDSRNTAAYVQDAFKILQSLTFHAGLRYDHSSFGGTANPRLALIYRPWEKTTFKFLFGQAFRAPNSYELYYGDGGITQKGNTHLTPERIRTYEATVDHYLGGHLRFSTSAYYYAIRDLIVQQQDSTDGLLVFNNAEKIGAKGLEFELEGKWPNGIESRFSYAVQNAIDHQSQQSLIDSPRHLGKANTIMPLVPHRLFLGVEGQYTSKRLTLRGNRVGGFPVVNLTIYSKTLFKGFDVSAGAYNVLDKRYADPAAEEHRQDVIVQDGRGLRLKLTYRF